MYPSGDWTVLYHEGRLMKDATLNFSTHWALNPIKTHKGSDGHTLYHQCQGVLLCSKSDCPGILRPYAKSEAVKGQLDKMRCPQPRCSARLRHVKCDAKCDVKTFYNGYIAFRHRGSHAHLAPPKLHLTPTVASSFRETVESNPDRTPVQLVTGSQSEGKRESIIKLDPSLANIDRVTYFRRQVLTDSAQPTRGGDKSIDRLADFMRQNPKFVIHHELYPRILIVIQTDYMAKCMIDEAKLTEDRYGFVTDANHGFFHSNHRYLFTTTTFSITLNRWVPIFLALSDGESEDHYRAYFLLLFKQIHAWLSSESNVTDEVYAQVLKLTMIFYTICANNPFVY